MKSSREVGTRINCLTYKEVLARILKYYCNSRSGTRLAGKSRRKIRPEILPIERIRTEVVSRSRQLRQTELALELEVETAWRSGGTRGRGNGRALGYGGEQGAQEGIEGEV